MPRYCQNCLLPDVRPGVQLDPAGICQGCINYREKGAIDWPARAVQFQEVAQRARDRGAAYDCLIPVSGGKDSFWQVVTCLEQGLKPLCVTYVYPGRNELGAANLRRLVEIGVDHLEFRINPRVERTFIEKSFRKLGMSALVTNMAIYSFPMQIAAAHGIPLVVYGENSAFEYGTEDKTLIGSSVDRRWLRSFGVSDGTTAADWIDDDLTRRDLAPFFVPAEAQLAAQGIEVIFLGYFFRWDTENSRRVASEHGFQARAEGPKVGYYNYANLDDDLIGVHHHGKWYKFGITRSWDNLSVEIRAGRVSRDEAIDLIRERGDETPWDDIERFCEYLEISPREYFATMEEFRNRDIWQRQRGKWVIEDYLIADFPWPADPEPLGRR